MLHAVVFPEIELIDVTSQEPHAAHGIVTVTAHHVLLAVTHAPTKSIEVMLVVRFIPSSFAVIGLSPVFVPLEFQECVHDRLLQVTFQVAAMFQVTEVFQFTLSFSGVVDVQIHIFQPFG